MQAVRKIQTVISDHVSVKVPKSFMKRSVEIIVIPIDDEKSETKVSSGWPKNFFTETAGCFASTPLLREDQGEYEVRDTIE